jgi:exonuclease SbcD
VVQHRPARLLETSGPNAVTAAQDPLEVAAQFLLTAGGRAPEEAELEVLRRAYESVLAGDRSA